MSFFDAIKSYFNNYATFKGRARRSEFWFTVLFTVLVSAALSIVFPGPIETVWDMQVQQSSAAENLWSIATIVPSLAVTWLVYMTSVVRASTSSSSLSQSQVSSCC